MLRTVLCFGDSNTYGSIPGDGGRFPPEIRWPGVLAQELGSGWRVVEDGLPGRTTVYADPLSPQRLTGADSLPPCLASHTPLDAVAIFLGTNDLKSRFAAGAPEIARGIGLLAEIALASGSGPDGSAPRVLVLGLPRLGPLLPEGFEGAGEKVELLPALLEQVATEAGAELLQLAGLVSCSPLDGIHLEGEGHADVGVAVARRLSS